MRIVVAAFLFFSFTSSRAAVVVQTNDSNAADVRAAIESGAWDQYRLEIPVERGGRTFEITLSKEKFLELPEADRDAVLQALNTYYNGSVNSSYTVWVDPKVNDLKSEPAMIRLAAPFETLTDTVLAEQLLSAFALKWAKKWSHFDGPNCYHTSMAAIFADWNDARYMGPQELLCHQRNYFDRIEKPELWGDMVSFDDAYGEPIHAFTYLGRDRKDPNRELVFTKNGYRVSPYLYMTYDYVYRIYAPHGIARVSFYRPKADAKAPDPRSHSDSPCYRQYVTKTWEASPGIGDALLEYRLRTKKLETIHLSGAR